MIAAIAAPNSVSNIGRSWLSTIIGPEPLLAANRLPGSPAPRPPRLTTTSAPVGSGSTRR